MAGDLRAKERGIITLSTTLASLSDKSCAATGTDLDARSGGNAPDDLRARFELVCQWATVTGIVAGTIVAELYLLPALDGTNFPDIDSTAGASRLPFAAFVGVFEAPKAPTAATNMRFISPPIDLDPLLYRVYIRNVSGQTMTANASVKVVTAQGQYT